MGIICDTELPMAKQKRGAQQVRIIGGKWKGRKLRFDGDAHLRPTPSRVRETLFNWLRPELAEARCLDAFAGSGVLGFEALSHGAREVVFIEKNPRTVRSLKASAEVLQAGPRAEIIKTDVLRYLSEVKTPFDVVFLDPPFAQPELLARVLKLLAAGDLVGRYVYAEGPSLAHLEDAASRAHMQVAKHTRAGDSHSVLLTLEPS